MPLYSTVIKLGKNRIFDTDDVKRLRWFCQNGSSDLFCQSSQMRCASPPSGGANMSDLCCQTKMQPYTHTHTRAQSDMHLLCGLCYTAVEDHVHAGPIFRMSQNKLQNIAWHICSSIHTLKSKFTAFCPMAVCPSALLILMTEKNNWVR